MSELSTPLFDALVAAEGNPFGGHGEPTPYPIFTVGSPEIGWPRSDPDATVIIPALAPDDMSALHSLDHTRGAPQ